MFRITALFLLLLISTTSFAQQTVLLNENNLSQFELLSTSKPFPACYRETSYRAILGKLNRAAVRSGIQWRSIDTSALSRQLSSLEAKRKKLQKRRVRGKALTDTLKRISTLKVEIRAYRSALRKCTPLVTDTPAPTATPIVGEFAGDAQSAVAYKEQISDAEIEHLLKKVAFGGSDELRVIGRTQGLTALVNALVDGIGGVTEQQRIDEESNYWASRFYYLPDNAPLTERIWTTEAAQAGEITRMVFTRNPLQEWMLLALAQHYALSFNKIGFSYNGTYHYGIQLHWELLKRNALGSLRTLAQEMFLDPAMNFWLNNKDNADGSPNQNYARELLELFLLGARDPVSGATNYGESSVVATTAFVSGYREDRQTDPLNGSEVISISYDPDYHDPRAFTLFQGIPGAEVNASLTPQAVVNHILNSHAGAARYLAERFAGQMLYPGLPENVVSSLAQVLRTNDYQIKPFLKTVLKSHAMFSTASRDSCIKSPVESAVSLARKLLKTPLPRTGERTDSAKWGLYDIASSAGDAGQSLFDPPSVFGWKGACNINRAGGIAHGEGWLPAQRLFNRSKTCNYLINLKMSLDENLLTTLEIPTTTQLNALIDQLAMQLYGITVTSEQRDALIYYMTHDLNSQGTIVNRTYNLTSNGYVWKKVGRLICLLYDLVDTATR